MLKSITFEAIGDERLHCEACEQRVERLLTALPGVRQVRAHAHNQHIAVLFDTTVLADTAIAACLGEAGYDTTISR